MTLEQLGWDSFFQQQPHEGFTPARITEEHRGGIYRLHTGSAQLSATLSGSFRKKAESRGELPAVGDWVGIASPSSPVIEHLFQRRSSFSRRTAGSGVAEQVIAANIDFVLVMTSLNRDLNVARLERYVAAVWAGGATPVVLLSKSDLANEAAMDSGVAAVRAVAASVMVLAISAVDGTGLDALTPMLGVGRTVALVGSSGVGKSTLTNRLLGRQEQAVREIREDDDRGRHTTVSRRLISLTIDGQPGAMLLDTPGMRELQLWDTGSDEGMSQTFGDITELAAGCRFRDCRHENEPGCAVRAALADERLDPRRMANFQKIGKELQFSAIKQDAALRSEQKKRWKKLHKGVREMYRLRDKPK